MSRKQLIPVSKLADYASDPEGYIERRGGVHNKKAAAAGTRSHNRLANPKSDTRWLTALVVVVAILLLLFVWSLR